MTEPTRDQVYNNLNDKDSGELLDIWKINNRADWTDTAFDIIKEILIKRQEELPRQNEPTYELSSLISEETPVKTYANLENEPVFYKPKDVLLLERFIAQSIKPIVIGTVIVSIPILVWFQKIIFSIFNSNPQMNSVAWFLTIVFCGILIVLQCYITIVGLKALSSLLTILMEMEFDSRGAKIK